MKQIEIEGKNILSGEIKISGAKNSAVALLPAALLTNEIVEIDNVPNISDIIAIKEILEYLNAKVEITGNKVKIDCSNVKNRNIEENMAKKLRASYYFMGVLFSKYKETVMYFPGGCPIGARPIDLHLKGFERMNGKIEADGNKYHLSTDKIIGSEVDVRSSVGATINILYTSVLAEGTTIIENAAREPEITNVVDMLNQMGAKIEGRGTSKLIIEGVDKLHGTKIEVIPDRIEAGTYIIAGAMIGDNLTVSNINPNHLTSLLNILQEMNVDYKINGDSITVTKSNYLKPVNIKTEVYPGFPTDLQQPITALLTQTNGKSTVYETIYENRFGHTKHLNKMGASIKVDDREIAVISPTSLHGSEVIATDLRAGACLILAALLAEGKTVINEVEHVLRGYENIINKLTNVGAKIKLTEI